MTPPRKPFRSLLGSTLWLHPVEPRDAPRLTAFLNRRDLLRSEGMKSAPGRGRRWLASDVWGAPVCLFALETDDRGEGVLSFAASRGDGAAFVEALRLLTDGVRRWTRLTRMSTRPVPDLIAVSGLRATGWFESAPGTWSRDLGPESRAMEAHRAG